MFYRVSTATMLEALYNIELEGVKKALRCQKAEHTFADTPCGIMDQYISSLGKEGNLLLIDCRTTSFNLVPYGKGDDVPVILVTNSNVKHKLSGSEYPDRVRQCKEAVAALQAKYPHVKALRDASEEMLENVKGEMSDVCYRRARHVIGENARTLATVEALTNKDFVVAIPILIEENKIVDYLWCRDEFKVLSKINNIDILE
jgi:galactokinase